MKKEYNISEAEWKVMEVLWSNPNITIKGITTALKDTDWSYSTIRTLVLRLCEKGAIGADTEIGNYKYYPIATEEICKRNETKNFINKIYNGSVKMLMASLVSDSNLTKEEVDDLMNIIEKIEDGEDK